MSDPLYDTRGKAGDEPPGFRGWSGLALFLVACCPFLVLYAVALHGERPRLSWGGPSSWRYDDDVSAATERFASLEVSEYPDFERLAEDVIAGKVKNHALAPIFLYVLRANSEQAPRAAEALVALLGPPGRTCVLAELLPHKNPAQLRLRVLRVIPGLFRDLDPARRAPAVQVLLACSRELQHPDLASSAWAAISRLDSRVYLERLRERVAEGSAWTEGTLYALLGTRLAHAVGPNLEDEQVPEFVDVLGELYGRTRGSLPGRAWLLTYAFTQLWRRSPRWVQATRPLLQRLPEESRAELECALDLERTPYSDGEERGRGLPGRCARLTAELKQLAWIREEAREFQGLLDDTDVSEATASLAAFRRAAQHARLATDVIGSERGLAAFEALLESDDPAASRGALRILERGSILWVHRTFDALVALRESDDPQVARLADRVVARVVR